MPLLLGYLRRVSLQEFNQLQVRSNNSLTYDLSSKLSTYAFDSGDPVAYMQSDFSCDGSFNLGLYCSESVDKALDNADLQPLGELRNKAIIAAERQILEDYAAIPLLHERVIQGETPSVSNVERDSRERRLITQFTQVQ